MKTRQAHWLKYFSEPGLIGPLETANTVGSAGGGCGDHVRIYLRINGDTIEEAAFLASGCPAAIAGASACAQLVAGKDFLKAAQITGAVLARHLQDLPEKRSSCLDLTIAALANAIENYERDQGLFVDGSELTIAAMSGGVDSAIAAALLHQQGEQPLGITLRLHDFAESGARACCAPEDIADARAIAAKIGFPHLVIDMRDEFSAEVIDHFCKSYLSGQTPNPCVECNRRIRFDHFLKKARDFGASHLATGHYVGIREKPNGNFEVVRARDLGKDQSYMFWAATQEVLKSFRAPLGEMTKKEVRELARELSLDVAEKPDSQDVCFVPDGDYARFVTESTGHRPTPGSIINIDGEKIGDHKGLIHYTVGQRRGLEISSPDPLYVLNLDMRENVLRVGGKSDLYRKNFLVSDLNIIDVKAGQGSFNAEVMIRYNSPLVKARVEPIAAERANIELEESFGPIAPGQSAVFYSENVLLGGGIIE